MTRRLTRDARVVTPEKVHRMLSRGITISEFSVELGVAEAATRLGLSVVVGAPGIVLGKSNTGSGIPAVTMAFTGGRRAYVKHTGPVHSEEPAVLSCASVEAGGY